MVVGALLVAVLTYFVLQAPVPYAEYVPGPTYNTLGLDDANKDVIVIDGAKTSSSAGQLRFVTVGVIKDINLLEALRAWWKGDSAVVPREFVVPPDMTDQQVEQQSAQQFTDSTTNAEIAALTRLGYPTIVSVDQVQKGLPADGVLQSGDVIVKVDGTPIAFADKLVDQVRAAPVGSTLAFDITRGGKPMTVKITTVKGDDGTSRVGVVPKQTQPSPYKISIPMSNVGGPSAGLMLALGITDKLDPVDLTGGKVIAGTGEIDELGNVGKIGGIAQKLPAAYRDHATIFLTPKDNCADAVANNPGLELVMVTTLDDALNQLSKIRSGQQPTLCPGAK